MSEDREELCINTPRTQSAEVCVRSEFISARVRQEPPQDGNPVEGRVTFTRVGSVHSEIEAVIQNERRNIVVAVYDDRFAVDPFRLVLQRLWICRLDRCAEGRDQRQASDRQHAE